MAKCWSVDDCAEEAEAGSRASVNEAESDIPLRNRVVELVSLYHTNMLMSYYAKSQQIVLPYTHFCLKRSCGAPSYRTGPGVLLHLQYHVALMTCNW